MQVRLQKILSQWGVASRRQAEQLISQGRVRVNGDIAQIGQKVDLAADAILIDDHPLPTEQRPGYQYLLLHKPLGVVSTCQDPQGRKTVLDFLPPSLKGQGVHPVGRLDINSTGALLLTNDGDLTYRLTHPRHDISKTYWVEVRGHPTAASLRAWRKGLLLEGRLTRPARVSVLSKPGANSTLLEVVLREGRNRQIRRVADQLGYPVITLHRVAIGTVKLGSLAPGSFRSLQLEELCALQSSEPDALTRASTRPVHCH